MNEDPIGFSGGINLYPYVFSSPANLKDPAGTNPAQYLPQIVGDVAGPISVKTGQAVVAGVSTIYSTVSTGVLVGVYLMNPGGTANWVNSQEAQFENNAKAKCEKKKKDDQCTERHIQEQSYCTREYWNYKKLLSACMNRACERWNACLRGLPDPGPLDPLDRNWSLE